MQTKYVCHGLISLCVNFHNNWRMWSTNLHVKNCRWGGKEKEPIWRDEQIDNSTTVNIFFLHTLPHNITHLAVITRKSNIKLGILKRGETGKEPNVFFT